MPPSPFPTYLQMRERVPPRVWSAARVLGLVVTAAVVIALFVAPQLGLLIFWGLIVPALPLLFFLAPGLWRNVCPMATLNQVPRRFGFTRALTMPKWFREYGYLIGIVLFLAIVPARKIVFDESGPALGLLIAACLAAAFAGGVLLKGKSGWCSTMCPLLPVQRLYGQTPFLTVRNAHCKPCVGCVKNCYDFNPAAAYMADLYDTDPHRSGYRKFFAAAFPGLIVAFYTVEGPPSRLALEMYAQFASLLLLSAGSFYLLTVFLKVTAINITTVYAAAALNLYYWFSLPIFAERLRAASGFGIPPELLWVGQGAIVALTAVWIVRTFRKETPFVEQSIAPKPARVASGETLARLRAAPEPTQRP
jgi:nitrite reductase (NADH) large subunit